MKTVRKNYTHFSHLYGIWLQHVMWDIHMVCGALICCALKRKCLHFDEIIINGCTGSCQNDNFQCSQWWTFRQHDDFFVWLWLYHQFIIKPCYLSIILVTVTSLALEKLYICPIISDVILIDLNEIGWKLSTSKPNTSRTLCIILGMHDDRWISLTNGQERKMLPFDDVIMCIIHIHRLCSILLYPCPCTLKKSRWTYELMNRMN